MADSSKQIVSREAAELDITQHLGYREYLRTLYERSKQALANYSYLKFAEDLGFSATNVIRLVIVGQRPLTFKAAQKIAISLGLRGSQRRYWSAMVKYQNARAPEERERQFRLMLNYKSQAAPTQLNEDDVAYFSEWYNPIIRELIGLGDFDGSIEWIQARLSFPLRREQIEACLSLLERLGEIRRDDASGRYAKTRKNVITDQEVDSMAVIRYHQKMIEIARESITRVSEKRRDIRALTLTLPESAIPLVKAKILALMEEVLALETDETPSDTNNRSDEVFQLNIQLFPFTKGH